MRPDTWKQNLVMAVVLSVPAAPGAWAQQDWLVFTDPDSDSVCGVINAANAKLIASPVTGQLTKVNGVDTLLANAFFDPAAGDVLVNGAPLGFVTFTTDAEGNRTAWWVTPVSNTAIELDEFTFAVDDSGQFPSQIAGASCDPTPLIDGLDTGNGSGDDPTPGDDLAGTLTGALCGAGTIGLFGTLFGLCGLRIRVRWADA